MESELSVKFSDHIFVDLPDDLVQRMSDIVTAVARGHGSSGTLIAEAQHVRVALDSLLAGVYTDSYGEQDD